MALSFFGEPVLEWCRVLGPEIPRWSASSVFGSVLTFQESLTSVYLTPSNSRLSLIAQRGQIHDGQRAFMVSEAFHLHDS